MEKHVLSSARPVKTGNAPDWGIAVFGVAIAGAAFLIFLVQPMVAKRILPWFGGTPAVWMLCLSFYQSALFLGYLYAHALVRWVPPGIQAGIHGCLLLAAIMALPILPADSWASAAVEESTLRIMTLLASEVALPFVVLAATGPLVQAWFARRYPTRSPYPLYALSNFGSMLALFAFPFIVEPRWPLSLAGRGWGVGLVCVALAIIACGVMALRAGPSGRAPDRSAGVQGGAGREPVGLWLVLSAAAVVLLMGVSNELCLNVASIPFLWILPLSIYLLTFILCFSDRRWIRPGPFIVLALLALAAIDVKAINYFWIVTMGWDVEAANVERARMLGSVYFEVCIYSLLLLSTCILLHGELYRRRPPPERLTSFYLYVSGGGALGGLFVGLLAPRIFPDYYELEAGLILALVGLVWAHRSKASVDAPAGIDSTLSPATGTRTAGSWSWGIAVLALILVVAEVGLSLRESEGLIWRERGFFGVLRVLETGDGDTRQRLLRHGSTAHGLQFLEPSKMHFPTSYYGRATPLGAWMFMRAPGAKRRIGVVGLGVGTIAAYGRPGDLIRFYEINPGVIHLAGPDGLYRYLSDSAATVEVELGDARLVLEEEQAGGRRQDFDLLVIDAFSSDSIPAHLMTQEAFEGYRAALADSGMIAVHVSNRHLQLKHVVSRLFGSIGFKSVQLSTNAAPKLQSHHTDWVFASKRPVELIDLQLALVKLHQRFRLGEHSFSARRLTSSELESIPLWTDDFANLFDVLKPL